MSQHIKSTVYELLHHHTNDYLLDDNLLELRHSIVNVDDCDECVACNACDTLSDDMSRHMNSHMKLYQHLYTTLNSMFHYDYSLDETVADSLVNRKKDILAVLLSNTVEFKDRVMLEHKIVQIDNRLCKSHGSNQQYTTSILNIMEHVKGEMFKLDDLMEYKLRTG